MAIVRPVVPVKGDSGLRRPPLDFSLHIERNARRARLGPIRNVAVIRLAPHIFSLAINRAPALNGHVFQIDAHQQRVQPALVFLPGVRRRQGVNGVVLGGKKRRARFQIKPDVAAQEKCARSVIAGGKIDHAPARLGTGIDGALNGLLRIIGLVASRAVIPHIESRRYSLSALARTGVMRINAAVAANSPALLCMFQMHVDFTPKVMDSERRRACGLWPASLISKPGGIRSYCNSPKLAAVYSIGLLSSIMWGAGTRPTPWRFGKYFRADLIRCHPFGTWTAPAHQSQFASRPFHSGAP